VIAADLVAACVARGLSIATAESLTAGLVSASIADVPGCSAVFRGGVVAYATDVKGSVLGLDASDLAHVVSEQVAAELARNACRLLDADLGISTTGVAGPDPLDGQDPGSVWIAAHDRTTSRTHTRHLALSGNRAEIRLGATTAAISLAIELVSGT
jgi:nicotinamide-nucleotide amidase